MAKSFHDINLPKYSVPENKDKESKKVITGVDESERDESEVAKEVHLISSEWKPGPDGFQYNKKCILEVRAEYLKKTIRKRIRGKLYGVFEGAEEDLGQEVEGFINSENGIAQMEIKHLWFVNDKHFNEWKKDKSIQCKYKIKGISHSKGDNTIDSDFLEMPQAELTKLRLRFDIDPEDISVQNDTFTLKSTDPKNSYSQSLTVKDDKIKNNSYLELEFIDINPLFSYTLEIDPGNEGLSFFFFENIPYSDLQKLQFGDIQ